MNTHLGKIQQRLEDGGCRFLSTKNASSGKEFKCFLGAELIASASTKAECIKIAAKKLGEAV